LREILMVSHLRCFRLRSARPPEGLSANHSNVIGRSTHSLGH